MTGTGSLASNLARIGELWKESYRSWFPRGVDDPELVLILVRPEQAEYWDNQGLNSVRYAFEAAKAYATGSRPQVREAEQHGKVSLGLGTR